MSSSNETEYLTATDENACLESGGKFHEIVDESQLETGTEHHYIEIIKDENGKMSSRFVDASAISTNGETTIVQADQLVSLDLMNYRVINDQITFYSCDDDDVVQEIITEDGEDSDGRTQYVLQSAAEDAEDVKNVVAVTDLQQDDNSTQYMHIVEKDSVPLVFFSSKPISPEIQQMEQRKPMIESRMKPKKGEFVLSHELLESPKFKLYLYNCKHCDFKCNAIKELTVHRTKEHASNGMNVKYRSVMPITPPAPLTMSDNTEAEVVFGMKMSYCSICSYSSITPHQVRRHISKVHGGNKRSSSIGDNTIIKYENIYSKESKSKKDRSFVQASNSTVITYYCESCDMGISNSEVHKCPQKSGRSGR